MAKKKTAERFPVRIFYNQGMSTPIGNIASQSVTRAQYISERNKHLRTVLGYPLPSWQRGKVWDVEQKIRFIQSIYKGIYVGLFVFNDAIGKNPEIDGLLIDGQQRLGAIESYLNDEFAVPGEDGNSYRWSELTEQEHAHFYRVPFGFEIVHIDDEAKLKELYQLLNFGGTPHTQTDLERVT